MMARITSLGVINLKIDLIMELLIDDKIGLFKAVFSNFSVESTF